MLEIVRYGQDEYDFPCLLVLGCFDGLHIGHQDLLKKAKLQAKINGLDLGVMLFADGKGGKQLYSFEERISYLEQYNVKFVLKIDFTDEFKSIKPLDFLACLDEKLNVKAYMSGKDFRFGNGKKGKSSTLKSYAEDEDNGVWYMPVKDVTYGDDKVSTTLIKSLLAQGNISLANELLGRAYSVTGKIVHGADRGGKVLGCPTINVVYPDCKFEIQHGVYKVTCIIDDKTYTGVANYGARPTFGEDEILLEVNLDDCNEDLYDRQATVEFIEYIRDIEKFDDPEKLSEQIKKDRQAQDEIAVTATEETAEELNAVNNGEESAEEVEPVEAVEEDEPLLTVSELIGETDIGADDEFIDPVPQPVEEPESTQDIQPEEECVQETEAIDCEQAQNEVVPEQMTEQVEETDDLIEKENDDFEEELSEEIIIDKKEIREVDAHKRNNREHRKEEKQVERDTSEETEENHTEIIEEEVSETVEVTEEQFESEEENND